MKFYASRGSFRGPIQVPLLIKQTRKRKCLLIIKPDHGWGISKTEKIIVTMISNYHFDGRLQVKIIFDHKIERRNVTSLNASLLMKKWN